MSSNRKTARTAGALFIIATVASLVGTGFTGSILDAPDYLTKLSVNGNHVLVGALLAFVAAAASASIAISLYPLLKRYNEGLALGSVGFRLIEGVFYIVGVIGLLLLLALSQEYVKAGSPDSSYFRTLGVLLLAGYHWAGFVLGAIAFSIGALMYYYIFYQTRLIPRWLSGWGLIGAALCMVAGLLVMLGLIIPVSTIHIVLNLPIAVQEMVFAVWLIVKAFSLSAIVSESAKTDVIKIK
jgi:hypothetical protein